jgi:galactokinase
MFGFGKPKEFNLDEYEDAKKEAGDAADLYSRLGTLRGNKQHVYDEAQDKMHQANEKVSKMRKVADTEVTYNVEQYKKLREETLHNLLKLMGMKQENVAFTIDDSPTADGHIPTDLNAIIRLFDQTFPEK